MLREIVPQHEIKVSLAFLIMLISSQAKYYQL